MKVSTGSKLVMIDGARFSETFTLKSQKSKCPFKAADSWLKLRPSAATKSWLYPAARSSD